MLAKVVRPDQRDWCDRLHGGRYDPSCRPGVADPSDFFQLTTPPWTGGGCPPEISGSLQHAGGVSGRYRGRGLLFPGGEASASAEHRPGKPNVQEPPSM